MEEAFLIQIHLIGFNPCLAWTRSCGRFWGSHLARVLALFNPISTSSVNILPLQKSSEANSSKCQHTAIRRDRTEASASKERDGATHVVDPSISNSSAIASRDAMWFHRVILWRGLSMTLFVSLPIPQLQNSIS